MTFLSHGLPTSAPSAKAWWSCLVRLRQTRPSLLFSSRLAQLCKDCLWAGSACGYPVWLSPIPTWSSSSKQINMFTATHAKSPSFWLKEAEGLMLSLSMAWEASRISFWPFLTYSLHGDFSAPIWLEQFLTVCGKTHINLSPVKWLLKHLLMIRWSRQRRRQISPQ